MVKIPIQFSESDYKIYSGYCLKYYRAHDATRKRSIHAFLDLYARGALPVEEQNINQARQILSLKCEELKRNLAGTGDTVQSQVRACSDLLVFCDDLEKMFRLLQKQGTGASYLMLLGTFSRVIEENKDTLITELYTLDANTIEALAAPLADIIRLRLGTDRHWRSVLRELTFIAARFNQIYPEPRFDLDVVRLVAPAVIAHFHKEVEAREILSVLPTYFEENELEEFEAFLNRTPEKLKKTEEKGINWSAILEPLKVVAGAVAEHRHQWSGSLPEPAGSPILPTSPGLSASPGIVAPTAANLSRPGEGNVFDITVGESPRQPVTPAPPRGRPFPVLVPENLPTKKYMPLIIGVSVVLIFIVGTVMITSGGSMLGLGNWTNSSASLNKTSIAKSTTPAKPAATTAKPAATTAKPAATTAKPAATTAPPAYSSADIGNHLVETAFGPNNNVITKPTKKLVSISMTGTDTKDDLSLVSNFITQFNNYSSSSKLSTNIDTSSPADITLVFLPNVAMGQVSSVNATLTYKAVDSGKFYFIQTENDRTYVNSDLTGNERKRWIQRALLCNLGFSGESSKYADSLFYTQANNAYKMSEIDLRALQLMYGTKVSNGMTKSQVKALI